MRMRVIGVVGMVAMLSDLEGCQSASTPAAVVVAPDQAHVCQVDDWHGGAAAQACHAGQKVAFLPGSFGNEQLPILFAAVNCDLRYSVALTTGGVTCIYAGPLAPDKPAASGSSGAASH